MLSSGTGRLVPPKISFKCECGKRYRVPATKAGKKVRCKSCKARIRVPDPIDEFDMGAFESENGDNDKISMRTRKAILEEFGINASAAEQKYEEEKRLEGYVCCMCNVRIPEELLKSCYSEHGLMCDNCKAAQIEQRELGDPVENERKKRAQERKLDKWSTSPAAKDADLKSKALGALIAVGVGCFAGVVLGLSGWIAAPIGLTVGVLAAKAYFKSVYIPEDEDEE